MNFIFDERLSDSPFVDTIWRTQSEGGGSFTSVAENHWEMVLTRQGHQTTFTIRGPETKATPAPIPKNAEFFGIVFKVGVYMPHLPTRSLVDSAINLPETMGKSFWLNNTTWQFPDYENADTFINRLVSDSLLVYDPVVKAILQNQPPKRCLRSVQRHFLQATGMTHNMIKQIERARKATQLLRQGISILDTVYQVGYADQPHLTRSLKHFIGQTPAQIALK